jgi:hypothetical protein
MAMADDWSFSLSVQTGRGPRITTAVAFKIVGLAAASGRYNHLTNIVAIPSAWLVCEVSAEGLVFERFGVYPSLHPVLGVEHLLSC